MYLGTSGGIQKVTCTGYVAQRRHGYVQRLFGRDGIGGGGQRRRRTRPRPSPPRPHWPKSVRAVPSPRPSSRTTRTTRRSRALYTTNGTTFTDLGIISGTDPTNQTDVNNPGAQAEAGPTASKDLAPGSQDNPELRNVGTRGTIILNADGTIGMFDSGRWESDGDSDAFNQIFYATSTDGLHGRPRWW